MTGPVNLPQRGQAGFRAAEISEAEAENARGKKIKILSLLKKGMRPAAIGNNLKLRTGAVRIVLAENGHPEEAPQGWTGGGVTPDDPDPATPTPDEVEPTGTEDDNDGADHKESEPLIIGGSSFDMNAPPPNDQPQTPQPATTPPRSRIGAPPYRGSMESAAREPQSPTTAAPFASASGAQPAGPRPSLLDAAYENATVYDMLLDVMIQFGLNPDRARGMIRRFRFLDPRDYAGLEGIMMDYAVALPIRQSVVKAYKSETTPPAEATGPGATAATNEPTAAELRKRIANRIGRPVEGTAMTPDQVELERLKQMDARTAELQLKKLELEVQQFERSVKGATAGANEDPNDWHEILVEINGFPETKKVRTKDLPLWAKYRVKSGPAQGEPDAASKAILDRLERMENREARAQEAQARAAEVAAATKMALEGALSPYRQALDRLAQAPQQTGPSESEKRLQDRVERMEREAHEREIKARDDRERDLQRQLGNLNASLSRVSSPEGQAEIRRQIDETNRQLGYVPKDEHAQLTSERLRLEGVQAAQQSETRARADLMGVITEKAKGVGTMKAGMIEEGLPKLAVDMLRQNLGGVERDGDESREPTDDELERQVDQMEGGPGPATEADGAGPDQEERPEPQQPLRNRPLTGYRRA